MEALAGRQHISDGKHHPAAFYLELGCVTMPFDAIDEIDPPGVTRKIQRQRVFTEDEIDDRLQELQEAVILPDDVWTCLLWIMCPEAMEERPLPEGPTKSLPGTAERLRVMALRVQRGQSVFHPGDATWEDASAERVAIAGCRLRNGVASRLNQPLVVQRHDGLHEITTGQLEGFLLPKESTMVVGKIAPSPRRRRKQQATEAVSTGPRQQTLFEMN